MRARLHEDCATADDRFIGADIPDRYDRVILRYFARLDAVRGELFCSVLERRDVTMVVDSLEQDGIGIVGEVEDSVSNGCDKET